MRWALLLLLAGGCEGTRIIPEAGAFPECFDNVVGAPNAVVADLELASADGTVVVRGVRELIATYNRGGWPSENWDHDDYRTLRLAIQGPDGLVCIRDPESLEYLATHHNFGDVFIGRDGGLRYEVVISSGLAWPATTTAFDDATGAIVWSADLQGRRCDSNLDGLRGCPF
ncbi:MAG: hypothetical protein K8H88_28335 [Sandaracinaceae bacterium]|nr:hypothetical protein [Sandaracinaceae bacterium]